MDKSVIEDYKKAGRIAREALEYGGKLIKVGSKVVDVLDKTEEFIRSKGASIAFPAQISMNHIAAHFCPEEDDPTIFTENDIVKLDVGAHINGYVGDNALTVDLTPNEKFKDLIKASKEARNNALKLAAPGVKVADMGKIIQETITSYGFAPIRNLSGHGLDHFVVHTKPTIPNFNTGESTILEEGMACACEPFASTGKGIIHETEPATVFGFKQAKPVRSPFAREALKIIKKFNGLPFTTRWISKELGIPKTRFALRELIQKEIIKEYPPLPDQAGRGCHISQSEHSFLVLDKVVITTKLD